MSVRSRLARLMMLSPVRRQSLIGLGTTVGSTLLGFASTVYIAHAAGAETLGAFYLLSAYLGFLLLASDPGLGGAASQRIAERDEPAAHFSAYLAVRLGLATVVAAGLLAVGPWLVDLWYAGLVPWLALALLASTVAGIGATGVWSSGRVGIGQTAELAGVGARVAIQVGAVAAGYGAGGLAGGLVAGTVVTALINIRCLPIRPSRFGTRHLASLAPFAFWSFHITLVAIVSANADTVLIGYLLSDREVGLYRIPLQLAALTVLSTMPLRASLGPRVAGWAKAGAYPEIADALARAWTFALALAVPAAVGGLLLADRLLYFVYGAEFVVATPALALLFPAQLVSVGGLLEAMTLSGVGRPRAAFASAGAGAAVLVAGDLVLIPVFGITGAALALLASTTVMTVLARLLLRRTVRVRLEHRPLTAIALATALMTGAVLVFRAAWPLESLTLLLGAIALGAAVYLGAVLALDPTIRDEAAGLIRAIV